MLFRKLPWTIGLCFIPGFWADFSRFESACFDNNSTQFDLFLFSTAEEAQTFSEAITFCPTEVENSQLGSIHSLEENAIAQQLLFQNIDNALVLDNGNIDVWIGFNDPENGEGSDAVTDPSRFQPTDGEEGLDFFFTRNELPWRDNRPINVGEQHCVKMRDDGGVILWDDHQCGDSLHVLCRSPCRLSLSGNDEGSSDDAATVVLLLLGIAITLAALVVLGRRHLKENRSREKVILTGYDSNKLEAGRNSSLARTDSLPTASVLLESMKKNPRKLSKLSFTSSVTSLSTQTFKSTISRKDEKSQQRIKAHSVAQSSVLSELSEVMSEITFSSLDDNVTLRVVENVLPLIERRIQPMLTSLKALGMLRVFHEAEIPEISLKDYLMRLCEGLNLWFYEDIASSEIGGRALFIALLYLKRLEAMERIKFQLTDYNKHRIFAILLLVAVKFSEDEVITNDYWSNVSGLPLEEVNELEVALCMELKFDFALNEKEVKKLVKLIKKHIKAS